MVKFIWNVRHLDCEPSANANTDVVLSVDWECAGFIDDGIAVLPKARKAGTCALPAPKKTKKDFTAYDDLTKDQVLQWCWDNGVDKAAVEAELFRTIRPLPWHKNG